MSQNEYFGDTGLDSLEVGGNNPIYGFLTSAMASGKALADDGKAYDSIQTAQDNASSFVLVGPGTFSESVTIDTTGLTLMGAGYDTLIDGGTTGHAIEISASDVSVSRLSVKTTAGSGNSYDCILVSSGSNSSIRKVWLRESDQDGIRLTGGSEHSISNVTADYNDGTVERYGVYLQAPRCIVTNSTFISNNYDTNEIGVAGGGDDCIVSNCTIIGHGGHGVQMGGNDCIIIGTRVHNVGIDGLETGGADSIIANSRVSDSGGSDVNPSGSTITDDNLTGSAN